MSATDDQQQRIQDHYEDPYHRGRCEHTTHFAEAQSASCPHGVTDIVAVELRVLDDMIEEVWFDGEGCELSQATASMVAEIVENKSAQEIAGADLNSILRSLGLRIESAQQPCCQVSLAAIQKALETPYDEAVHGPTFSGPDLGDEC